MELNKHFNCCFEIDDYICHNLGNATLVAFIIGRKTTSFSVAQLFNRITDLSYIYPFFHKLNF